MKSQEKQDIFHLLKTAASWTLGYESPEFQAKPEFQDDVLIHKKTTDLSDIAKKVSACKNCSLGTTRINAVPGEGVEQPYVMVIGEGPGEDEDKTGRPFVGKAGQLLDKMLASINLDRDCNCFIANIVKCRPPHNRTPLPQEAEACSGYLQAQIHIAKPKMILAMGRTAIQNLMNTSQGINALRGKFLDYNGIPVMATYHPSALLRDEQLKRPAWEDLKIFRARLEDSFPDYKASFIKKHSQAGN
ncbi:MAG: uracil-DNA glycosylase [Treponema sp.]|nr:uracil-DNA glycosylase [Treponema sp.]